MFKLCYVDLPWCYFTTQDLTTQRGDVWLDEPCENYTNSPYSVQAINAGEVPWLQDPTYIDKPIKIMAGCDFDKFVKIIKECGGTIYEEI